MFFSGILLNAISQEHRNETLQIWQKHLFVLKDEQGQKVNVTSTIKFVSHLLTVHMLFCFRI